jgi:uncharacterized protein YbbC (DUF1343 family)
MRRREFLGATGAGLLLPPGVARAAATPAVAVGLERLVADSRMPLRGRRVGLVCHAASVTADGTHAIDALRKTGAKIVRLFGPEHGLRGAAAAGQKVAGGVDPKSGIPVVSLYGEKSKPSPQDLAGLDALIVDLQDAGVRFYTYSSTMLLCIEAAAEAGIEMVVLDRPNPLGGLRIEGPEIDPTLPARLVSMAPGPLVHGLTFGEMARYATDQGRKPGTVSVVAMAGWAREMTWAATGRPWVNPSPNLRSAEAALAYPGTCLLEATNATEGRGTDAPFLLVGAPWVKPEALAREAETPGFALEPATFTPTASPAAPHPKLLGAACKGVRVRVTDASAARPFALGLRLLLALKRHPDFAWLREGAGLDSLLRTKALRLAIERGDGVDAILAEQAPGIERWRSDRAASLLYNSDVVRS